MANSKPANTVIHFSDCSVIALTRKDGTTLPCYIDTADYDLVQPHRWYALRGINTFYAVSCLKRLGGKRPVLAMHQLILPLPKNLTPDHVDRNGLNNQRTNLRGATKVQQGANQNIQSNNTSGFRGVYFDKISKKYKAQICSKGKRKGLGYFDSPTDAALAYDAFAIHLNGDFARVNFKGGSHE